MSKKGFTLIEILVAVFLTGLVMAGLIGLWVSSANFSSSTQQELMYRNRLSIATTRIQRDILRASFVDVNQASCNGATQFLAVHINSSPRLGGCVANAQPHGVVFWCYIGGDTRTIFRQESAIACGANTPACNCGAGSENILTNVAAIPPSTTPTVRRFSNLANAYEVDFESNITVGRHSRPVRIRTTRTFNALSGE